MNTHPQATSKRLDFLKRLLDAVLSSRLPIAAIAAGVQLAAMLMNNLGLDKSALSVLFSLLGQLDEVTGARLHLMYGASPVEAFQAWRDAHLRAAIAIAHASARATGLGLNDGTTRTLEQLSEPGYFGALCALVDRLRDKAPEGASVDFSAIELADITFLIDYCAAHQLDPKVATEQLELVMGAFERLAAFTDDYYHANQFGVSLTLDPPEAPSGHQYAEHLASTAAAPVASEAPAAEAPAAVVSETPTPAAAAVVAAPVVAPAVEAPASAAPSGDLVKLDL